MHPWSLPWASSSFSVAERSILALSRSRLGGVVPPFAGPIRSTPHHMRTFFDTVCVKIDAEYDHLLCALLVPLPFALLGWISSAACAMLGGFGFRCCHVGRRCFGFRRCNY